MDWVKKNYKAVTTVVGTHAFKSDLRGVEDFFYACREYLFDLARLTAMYEKNIPDI